MAVANLLGLLEDITTMLDQVAAATKVAAKKTAGVVADDMALNAQQVVGVPASRELSVVWAVAKGSLFNKVIIVPTLLLISALAPKAVTVLLLVGGAFLCFEGFEKVVHKLLHSKEEDEARKSEHLAKVADPDVDLATAEQGKVKGAVRTDFILSAEIAVIALGAVSDRPMPIRVATLVAVSVAMTVGVYGLVAVIVRFDDMGVWLVQREGDGFGPRFQRGLGRAILRAAPWVMRALSFLGTTAMFLVGGSIVAHNVGPVHKAVDAAVVLAQPVASAPLARTILEGVVGVLTGLIAVLVVTVAAKVAKVARRAKGEKAA
jgi:predicted DNA repair protein MutK